MAHAYMVSIEEELTCCVCFELFIDPHTPKDLDCPHVICELCLNNIIIGSTVDCPECRVATVVPKSGVTALKTNFRVRNLAHKHHKHLENLSMKHLGQQQLQQSCLSIAGHRQDEHPHVLCSHHEGEKMHLFCVTCDVMVCQVCIAMNHENPQHKIIDVKMVHRGKMTEMNAAIRSSEKIAVQYEKILQELDQAEKSVLSSVKKQEERVDQAVALVVMKAHERGDALKADIRRKNHPRVMECQKQRTTLQKQAHDLQRLVADARIAVEDPLSHNNVVQCKKLVEKIRTIQVQRSVPSVAHNPYEIEFTVGQLVRMVGSFDQEQRQKKSMSSVQLKPKRKLSIFTRWNTRDSVMCIALNRTRSILAVCECNRKQVQIYSKQVNGQYKKKSNLNVPDKCGTGNCYTTITTDGRFLVTRGRSVHVYSALGNYQKHFFTTHDVDVAHLTFITTTQDDRILVGDDARRVVTVHASDGTLMKTFHTSMEPTHLAAVNRTHVVLSSYAENRTCMIDLESGKETLSFDISGPVSVCYDKKTDCLLVGRCKKNSTTDECMSTGLIEQYCLTTGQLVACIAQGIHSPQAMAFTDDGFLVVGDHHKVTLYKASFH